MMLMTKPNVLIYFMDELRADVLGCYDHPFVKTPNIDRIAEKGVLFKNTYSNNPLCAPARNSFFTGLYPSEHNVLFNWLSDYARENRQPCLFGELLKKAGYDRIINIGKHHTGFSPENSGFTENYPTPDKRGAGPANPPEGVDEEELIVIPGNPPNTIIGGTYPEDGSDSHPYQTVDKAMEILQETDDKPWVLRLSIDSPHTPVLPPEPFASMYKEEVSDWEPDYEETSQRMAIHEDWIEYRGFDQIPIEDLRKVRSSYYGLTSYVDREIGRLESFIKENGYDDNLITIFIADHGSSIGDHLTQVKGSYDTDDIAHVPFIIRYPEKVKAGVYEGLTQTIDVLPTLAELIGEDVTAKVSGKSLCPALQGSKAPIHQAIFSEGIFPIMHKGLRETIRTEEYLYTRYSAEEQSELFNLKDDPEQTKDLSQELPERKKILDEKLDVWRKKHLVDPAALQVSN